MDINKIDYFFAAAELQNFTQASDKCNIAQTTMSKYIVSLENDLGVSLFHRTNKGCALTEHGQKFYSGMKKIYGDYNDLVTHLLVDEKAELRFGIDGEFSMLAALQAFENTYRNISLSFTFNSRKELFNDLHKQKLHAVILPDVIMPFELRDDRFVSVDLMSEEALLTYSSVAQERFVTIGEMVESLPFITKSSDQTYHEYCREVLYKHFGSMFKDVQIVESVSKQQLLVSLSQGFAIIPASEIAAGTDLRQRSMGDEFIEKVQLVYKKNHVPAHLKEFIRFVRSQSREI